MEQFLKVTTLIRLPVLLRLLVVGLGSTGCNLLNQAGLFCDRYPNIDEVEQVLAAHPQAVKQIEAVNPGFTEILVRDVNGCPGKASLEILYATRPDQQKIQQLLGKTFWGIPYRSVNI